jgi:hypothetical protein
MKERPYDGYRKQIADLLFTAHVYREKVERRGDFLRRAADELKSFPHPEQKKKDCKTCKLIREIMEELK